ncbi:Gfo/Idh/MocA family oxidoreductase [Mesorhizobium sp. B3-1-6]|uniref:Gfo/Idh/MocA family protein n=1 Tax=Mesorhizobium sp. B3-1-6 TaxID=2589895 RepID=UPI0011297B60|nr:Gfo/Idh/MocA family oxidoreductase [Mesorhizobium sp. B3-1-6]TPI41327.1 Gfo/Idh/MocA family oxidoreductase [Mesorhizobium sp. B3-1-6]
MKVVFIGVSHWHLDLYMAPFLDVPDVELVGISDPDPEVVRALSARFKCEGDTDFKRLCRKLKPDFVFALGRHIDMPGEAEFLITERIPFAIEKPCGLTRRDVARIAEQADRAGVFAAVPLVFRNGDFTDHLLRQKAREDFHYMSFRFIAGFPARYRAAGCAWMLDPALSGGGSTINLAVHFFDLALRLLGPDLRVLGATMGNTAWHEAIEDYSIVTLERKGALCVIETGYLYPAPTSSFDMHYAFRSPSHYVIAHGPQTVESLGNDGQSETWQSITTNVPHYRTFVFDVLERARAGEKPLATLSDMVPIMGLIEDAYAKAGRQAFHMPGTNQGNANSG